MKVGMIGLGKLGLPCLLAMEAYGQHEVFGYDISADVKSAIQQKQVNYWEAGVNELLQKSHIRVLDTIDEIVSHCEIVFVAVQTPHEEAFEGKTPVPAERKDFNYTHLKEVAMEMADSLKMNPESNPLIVVISTVLPGTMRNSILPILENVRKDIRFAYNPYFIAMGTTIFDFLHPEFFLIGGRTEADGQDLAKFYSFIDSRKMQMQIESAELTKVAYNTFIGFKIIFANSLAEIVSKRGGNVDEITNALASANNRIMSGAYMRAGMGDGGGCHPRDQIAMSWLAQELELSVDLFECIAKARDAQTAGQADLIIKYCKQTNCTPVLLGISYKPNSPLDVGSPARLLENILTSRNCLPEVYDPWVYPDSTMPTDKPYVYFISSRHDDFKNLSAITGSTIIDPWGLVEQLGPDNNLIQPGRA